MQFQFWAGGTMKEGVMASSFVYFNSRDELLKVDLKRVVFFEAETNYTKIVLSNGLSNLVLLNLGKMEDLLSVRTKEDSGMFARIGKRYIVPKEALLDFLERAKTQPKEHGSSDEQQNERGIKHAEL